MFRVLGIYNFGPIHNRFAAPEGQVVGKRGMLLFYRDDKADKEEKLDLLPLRIIACLPLYTMGPNYFLN
jgi:hypothetical protein